MAQEMTGALGMRCGVVGLLALLLVACAPDVRAVPLSEVDFSDTASVNALGSQLNPDERTALLTYAAIHLPGAVGFCGQNLVGARGEEPVTVGDAIRLTLAREREVREALAREQEAKTSIEQAEDDLGKLIDRKELLIHQQSVLLAEHGGSARRLPEWQAIQTRIDRYDAELEVARRKLESAASAALPATRTTVRYAD